MDRATGHRTVTVRYVDRIRAEFSDCAIHLHPLLRLHDDRFKAGIEAFLGSLETHRPENRYFPGASPADHTVRNRRSAFWNRRPPVC